MNTKDFSDGLVEVLEAAGPGVVRVDARRRYPLSGTVWGEGLIVTTSRAVERDEVLVTVQGGETHPASLVGRDPSTDLALLRLTPESGDAALAAPTWVGGEGLRLGQLALMVGRPGEGLEASLGMVGALGGAWRTGLGGRVAHALRVDARPFSGFSGGPLLNLAGAVLGVNTAALTREAPSTVPTETVRRVVEALLTHGRMRRGYLGVAGQSVRLPEGLREAAGQPAGLLVTNVEPGTSAADAGLVIGDVLLTFGETRVRHPAQLAALLGEEAIGQPVKVTLVRGGQTSDLSVTVGERS